MSVHLKVDARMTFPALSIHAELDEALAGITALFGPSGGGKSTLLRMIAGLERRAEGRIEVDGEVWLDSENGVRLRPDKRPVGMVFQDARLFSHLNVRGNLRFAARRAGRNAPVRFDEVVEALDLTPLLPRSPSELSGGEGQRVALGRTLLTSPRLLLLDEPLSALDIGRKGAILPYLRAIPERFGIPALYVSHAMEEVAQLAARCIVLADGRVRAIGSVEDVFMRLDLQPLTGRFEAGALIEAKVTGEDLHYALTRLEVAGQPIAMPRVPGLSVGEMVRLRIRARDVALASEAPASISTRNALRGVVERIEAEPDTAFAEVFVTLDQERLRARITREAVDGLGLVPGAPVWALIKSASFDRRAMLRR